MHETPLSDLQNAPEGALAADFASAKLAMSAGTQGAMRSDSQDMLPPPLEWRDYSDTQFQWTIGKSLALAVPAALVAGIVIGLLM